MRSSDVDQILRDVGRRVAEARTHRGWTQEEFAEEMGYSLKFAQRVEAGRENLTVKSLANLSEHLGVEVKALFSKPRTKKPGPGRPKQRTRVAKTASR
jgi:transcriptional regulator with XRE-family HTH domain